MEKLHHSHSVTVKSQAVKMKMDVMMEKSEMTMQCIKIAYVFTSVSSFFNDNRNRYDARKLFGVCSKAGIRV